MVVDITGRLVGGMSGGNPKCWPRSDGTVTAEPLLPVMKLYYGFLKTIFKKYRKSSMHVMFGSN